ncbi:hypothetical protein AB0M68_03860 [Streptomyces sp. NPDC051453]|uniref:hypothetical protein n=1 Tax=Streptomyces sp. NPDC051453 TaxID=3154941 RepID=UPI003435F25B
MTVETTTYMLLGRHGQRYEITDAIPIAPGLFVFRLPGDLALNNPARWNIGHHSGRVVAEALTREAALAGAEKAASLYDWSQDVEFLREEIDDMKFYRDQLPVDCFSLNTHYERGDVSRNGIYTDADIAEAAREAKADGLNALQILNDMADTVPWSGLDTDDFNEAHGRIAELADAA